jgi:hypothetical protein
MNVLFLSNVRFDYSRSAVQYLGSSHQKSYLTIQIRDFFSIKKVDSIKKAIRQADVICIMSPGHSLTLPIRVLTLKKIILDAGWPLSDSTSSSISTFARYFRKCKNVIIDFIAFHACSTLILESESQSKRVSVRFLINRRKIKVIYSGVAEARFQDIKSEKPTELPMTISGNYLLFRGKINSEAGIYEIIKFFLREKDFNLVIASPDFQVKNLDSENIHLLSRYLSDQEIKWLYTNAYFSLGQFGRTKRQQRSIPHKYFEASYFGCSYVSLKSTALNEMGISAGVIQIDTIEDLRGLIGESSKVLNKREAILQNYREFLSNPKLVSDFESLLTLD